MRRAASLLCLSLLIPKAASAGNLRYQPAAGCPSGADVQKRFDERAPNAGAVDLTIRSSATDAGFVGEAVVGTDVDAVHRQIEGRTCDAVVDAAVVIASLARPSPEPAKAASSPTLAPASPGAERDVAPTVRPERARSPVEIGIGAAANVRQFSTSEGYGGGLFVEVGAPMLWASWYRPSARLGFQYLHASAPFMVPPPFTSPQSVMFNDTRSTYLGGTLDLCPLGVAPVSSRHLDVTLSACATANLGDVGSLWTDIGGLGRAQAQIGRKDAFRAFVDLSGGAVTGGGGFASVSATTISSGATMFAFPPRRDVMWTFALAGGVLFP